MLRIAKRMVVVVGVLLVLAFALIGVLSVTRGTPVRHVLAVGDDRLPGVRDSLFRRIAPCRVPIHVTAGDSAWMTVISLDGRAGAVIISATWRSRWRWPAG